MTKTTKRTRLAPSLCGTNSSSLNSAPLASQKCRHLILGACGCGVFCNDPEEIAAWWRELLEESFPGAFETVVFAVLVKSASQACITPFRNVFANA